MHPAIAFIYESTQTIQEMTDVAIAEIRSIEVSEVAAKIYDVMLNTFYVTVACALAYRNPQVFFIGYLVSMAYPDFIESAIERIKAQWNNQLFVMQAFTSLGAILAWPLVLISASFLAGGKTRIVLQNLIDPPLTPRS